MMTLMMMIRDAQRRPSTLEIDGYRVPPPCQRCPFCVITGPHTNARPHGHGRSRSHGWIELSVFTGLSLLIAVIHEVVFFLFFSSKCVRLCVSAIAPPSHPEDIFSRPFENKWFFLKISPPMELRPAKLDKHNSYFTERFLTSQLSTQLGSFVMTIRLKIH